MTKPMKVAIAVWVMLFLFGLCASLVTFGNPLSHLHWSLGAATIPTALVGIAYAFIRWIERE